MALFISFPQLDDNTHEIFPNALMVSSLTLTDIVIENKRSPSLN